MRHMFDSMSPPMRPICHTPERGCSRRLVLWIGSESPVPHVLEGALACQLNSKTFTKNAASSAYGPPGRARLTYFGLHALQHRGQEAPASSPRPRPSHRAPRPRTADPGVRRRARDRTAHRRQGDRPRALCHRRIGHHRQHPAVHLPVPRRRRALGHNGNLTNCVSLRRKLEDEGAIFHSNSDTEVLMHLIRRSSKPTFMDKLKEALNTCTAGSPTSS